jgi:hypothetical protein
MWLLKSTFINHCKQHCGLRGVPSAEVAAGGLFAQGHGIIGCFRFTDSYYLLVVARREYVGHICGKCSLMQKHDRA